MEKVEILNNVKITTFDDERQIFEPLPKQESTWQKIKKWLKSNFKSYAKIRDLSDPIGKRKEDPFDDGSDSKIGAEIGIKIEF